MIKNDFNFNSKKLYNDGEHHENMATVPFIVEKRQIFIELGGNPENMETFHTNKNKPYYVAYTEVPVDSVESYMRFFNQEVSSYLDNYGENSYKEKFCRCIINGKPCGIRNHCSSCNRTDENGVPFSKSKKGILSLDDMYEDGHELTSSDEVDLEILLDDLIAYLSAKNPIYGKIISDLYKGIDKSEILKKLPVQKSQGYEKIKEAMALAKEYLNLK